MKQSVDMLLVSDLVLYYYEAIDACGHSYGPESDRVYREMRLLDGHLEYLLESLDRRRLADQVNIYIVSDHGMTTVRGENLGMALVRKSLTDKIDRLVTGFFHDSMKYLYAKNPKDIDRYS